MAATSGEVLLTSAAGAGSEVSRLEERLREAEADPERESEGVRFIDHDELMARTRELPACAYRDYLEQVAEDLV